MLSALDWALLLVAVLAGVTGTWSPCGLSTIDTLRVGGVHGGGRTRALAVSLAFGVGALAGGITTFGALALLGHVLHAHSSQLALAVSLLVASGAAILELRGARIVPQVRRQVPEPWRRRLPVTLAATLYGVLLGLGFTTFVMTFAVWALALIATALGNPHVGLLIGIGFGVGRATPVIVLAPIADRPRGARILNSMVGRPSVLRLVRIADGISLAASALALALSTPAQAASAAVAPARGASDAVAPAAALVPLARARAYSGRVDPSVAAGELAWQEPGVGGFFALAGHTHALAGEDPALGGRLIAWRSGNTVTVANRLTLAPIASVPTPGADLIAISDRWLAYRVPPPLGTKGGRYALIAVPLASLGAPVEVASTATPGQLGRPALSGDTLTFAVNGRASRIVAIDLAHHRTRVLRSTRFAQLLNPSLAAGRLLYERVDECRQQLILGQVGNQGHDRAIASRATDVPRDGGYEPGVTFRVGRTPHHCIGPVAGSYRSVSTYWSTALSSSSAFLTVLDARGAKSTGKIVRIPLRTRRAGS